MTELNLFDDLEITVPGSQAMQPLFQIENRRFEGCKQRIANWIINNIRRETGNRHGTFCDLFGGTGVMTKVASPWYDHFIVNDFLHSNNVIYKAFFGDGDWDKEKLLDLIFDFNKVDAMTIPDNYCSQNYGDKYFEMSAALKIGYIREEIERMKTTLTEKEYNVLLASLLYSVDRVALTCGHYDDYRKGAKSEQEFVMRMVDAKCRKDVEIFREDANRLVRHVHCDVMYIDPPYNSRQYCCHYHVLESIVKWDKPMLRGKAMKPTNMENKSDYCRTKALSVFRDLIANADTEWLVVSYNNCEHPKSETSRNKMTLEEIRKSLELCGETHVFNRKFKPFSAGKTVLENHKEYLFITHVDNERRSNSFADILPGE